MHRSGSEDNELCTGHNDTAGYTTKEKYDDDSNHNGEDMTADQLHGDRSGEARRTMVVASEHYSPCSLFSLFLWYELEIQCKELRAL